MHVLHVGCYSTSTAGSGDSSQPWCQAKQLHCSFHCQLTLLLVSSWNHCSHIQSTGEIATYIIANGPVGISIIK